MSWSKLGQIYRPTGEAGWRNNSALTPTPLYLAEEKVIRIFAGFRDELGVSRIGFVDVEPDDPTTVLRVSEHPALDIGRPGMFDDNGLILGDLMWREGKLWLYYIGFQKVAKAKFLAFTGLAYSLDSGQNFQRFSETPIMDRSDNGLYIRAIHTIRKEYGRYRAWYAAGDGWEYLNGIPYPQYAIYCLESVDGLTFEKVGALCLPADASCGEYRIGRPRVYKVDDGYIMLYTYGTVKGEYLAGMAVSRDGQSWERRDHALGLAPSLEGWDSRHVIYPSLVVAGERRYVIYNGNHMGRDGFGCAVWQGGEFLSESFPAQSSATK